MVTNDIGNGCSKPRDAHHGLITQTGVVVPGKAKIVLFFLFNEHGNLCYFVTNYCH